MARRRSKKQIKQSQRAALRKTRRIRQLRKQTRTIQRDLRAAMVDKRDTQRRRASRLKKRLIDEKFVFPSSAQRQRFEKRAMLATVVTRAVEKDDEEAFFHNKERDFYVKVGPRGGISKLRKDRIVGSKFRKSQKLRQYWKRVNAMQTITGASLKQARRLETYRSEIQSLRDKITKAFPGAEGRRKFKSSLTELEQDLLDELFDDIEQVS